MTLERCVLVTGVPAPRARFLVSAISEREPEVCIVGLVHPERYREAEAFLASLDSDQARRVTLCPGDPAAMDFGLSGQEYLSLANRVDQIHAAYSVVDADTSAEECERVNLGSAREVIEFGQASPRRPGVIFYSSVFVSGNRSGRILEGELEAGQSFRSAAERTLAIAERMLRRSMLRLTVLRAGHLLGDAQVSDVELLSGLIPFLALLANAPPDSVFPLPPGTEVHLPLTPADRLATLGALVGSREIFGKTVHVVDHDGLTLRQFLELCAEGFGRALSPGIHPSAWTRALLKNPARRLLPRNARGILELVTSSARYDTQELSALTEQAGLPRRPLESYIELLVEKVRARIEAGTLLGVRRPLAPWLIA